MEDAHLNAPEVRERREQIRTAEVELESARNAFNTLLYTRQKRAEAGDFGPYSGDVQALISRIRVREDDLLKAHAAYRLALRDQSGK